MAKLFFRPSGAIEGLYTESIDLGKIGRTIEVRRASHVEPDGKGGWLADLSPVDGPALGPFPRRSEALKAEADWLNERLARGMGVNHAATA